MSALAASLSFAPGALPATSMPAATPEPAREHEFARCLDRARDSGRPRSEGMSPRAREQAPAGAKEHGAGAAASPRAGASTARAADGADAADAAAPADPMSPPTDDDNVAVAAGEAADNATGADVPACDLSDLLPGWTPASTAPVVASAAADAAAAACAAVGAASAAAGAASAANAAVTDEGGAAVGVSALSTAAGTNSAVPQAHPANATANATPATPAAAATLADADGAAQTLARIGDNAAATLPPAPGQQASVSERKASQSEAQPALPNTVSAAAATAASPMATPVLKATEALPPTATAAMHAAIDSPGFAPALATQVRWWAQGGVQQAQLTLHPAEMGPVAVRIVLDGREARIDFSADVPATRGAIEAALPVLAASLDDSGLKLTGGGVHDGAAGRQRDWHASAVTHRTGEGLARHEDATLGGGSTARNETRRGLVDLVA